MVHSHVGNERQFLVGFFVFRMTMFRMLLRESPNILRAVNKAAAIFQSVGSRARATRPHLDHRRQVLGSCWVHRYDQKLHVLLRRSCCHEAPNVRFLVANRSAIIW